MAADFIGATAFTLWSSPVTWLELGAALAGVAMVVCNLRVWAAAWPLAMASSAAYGLLFWHSGLFGEAALQVLFIAMAAWGWWQWLRGTAGNGQALQVSVMPPRQRRLALLATLAAWPALALLLQHATTSDLPWLDALPTVGSITGTLLLARKRLENWPVWVAVNAVSLVLFAAKALWLTVALYALFGVLALVGWRAWRRLVATAG
jgi:nicotinamide mononucleotide transporter